MFTPPDSIEVAVSQSIDSCFSAIDRGITRLLVDLRFPELRQLPVAHVFAQALTKRYGEQWQGIFADAGSAALAQRDWSDISVQLRGVNEGRRAIGEDKQVFLIVVPTSVELDQIEKLLELAQNRPFILLNPIYCEIMIRRLERLRTYGKTGWQNGNPFEKELYGAVESEVPLLELW